MPVGWIAFLVVLLAGCSDGYMDSLPTGKHTVSMSINLSVPGVSPVRTRAMDVTQESAIDGSKLHVLVFEQSGPSELFRYKATIANIALPQITLKVPVSKNQEKYRFVIMANVDVPAITDGMPKEEVLETIIFNCSGKWNASSSNADKIPMWGELDRPIRINEDKSISINLHRALARVDVGVLFQFNNSHPESGQEPDPDSPDKESVYGMDKFKIKNVRVYRTKSKAYAASSVNRMTDNEVTTPWIPFSAQYNSDSGNEYATLEEADKHPLVYELDAGADSYIREIYIPESNLVDAESDMDEVACIVVGGYYGAGNTTEVTYYRADFATYTNGQVNAYKPILRNHRYVFDIKSVNGPGFEKPEQALKAISSPMTLNVVDWNEVPLNFYVQGDYYLSVKEREFWMEARPKEGENEITYLVPFDTNLVLDGSNGKNFEHIWTSSGTEASSNFEMSIDYTNKTITFKAEENIGVGSIERSDVVTLTTENFRFTIKVNQKAFKLNYDLLCDETKVHGKYREGIPLNYTNFITIKVRTNGAHFDGESYEIKSEVKNGIYFKAEGVFDSSKAHAYGNGDFEYEIKLEGFGTPVKDNPDDKILEPFNLMITSNSMHDHYCEARIVVGYKTKKILTIGANAGYRYGYMLEPNTASRAFVDASVNFGTDPNSTVTMEQNESGNAFTIKVFTIGSGMTGERIDYTALKNTINTFKPDIILTGQAINYYSGGDGQSGTAIIDLLSDYVDAGGVFIMCNEYYPVASSINDMVAEIIPGASGANYSIGYDQGVVLNPIDGDPITEGPFGDMRGKEWGADGHILHAFTNLPENMIVYSSLQSGEACMFRHPTKPFFFMGEGGFISNPQRYIGDSYPGSLVYCPFAIDVAYRPVARVNYVSGTVYNSQIFGNILTWAVDYAEREGIEYPETGNKFQ